MSASSSLPPRATIPTIEVIPQHPKRAMPAAIDPHEQFAAVGFWQGSLEQTETWTLTHPAEARDVLQKAPGQVLARDLYSNRFNPVKNETASR